MSTLSAKKVYTEYFDEREVHTLTKPRLKALKRAMYKNVGHHFFCCEFNCYHLITEAGSNPPQYLLEQWNIFNHNMSVVKQALEIKE